MCLLSTALLLAAAACAGDPNVEANSTSSTEDALKGNASLSSLSSLQSSEFVHVLSKSSIRALQTWVDDTTFEAKWASMLSAPIEFFGGADSAYHADLASLPSLRLPGAEVLCHGDPKFDNFGWTKVDGRGLFSNNDFDETGFCPVAADALRYLVATDLWFSDSKLNNTALSAYVDTVEDVQNQVSVDPSTEPNWDDVRTKGIAKSTVGDSLVLGGEVQQATPNEVAAVRALVAADKRFPSTLLDVARNVRTSGGSAGLRRFWVFSKDDQATRTIIELKELTTPGTEFGRFSRTVDGPDRFDVLKSFWWNAAGTGDHYTVYLLDGRFLVRDRLIRANPKPDKMNPRQVTAMVQAEASLLAAKHRDGWRNVSPKKLKVWLHDSAAVLTTRWRAAYAAAGGT